MKTFLVLTALVLATLSPVGIGLVNSHKITSCKVNYASSFDGLWLIKEQVCYGRLGFEASRHEIARKPLFTEF